MGLVNFADCRDLSNQLYHNLPQCASTAVDIAVEWRGMIGAAKLKCAHPAIMSWANAIKSLSLVSQDGAT